MKINPPIILVRPKVSLPKDVPNKTKAVSIAGPKSLRNLLIDFTLSAFLGSPNHSNSLYTILPRKTVTKKLIILSKRLLTGASIFSAAFFNPSNLFSKLLSARLLFSCSAFLLS